MSWHEGEKVCYNCHFYEGQACHRHAPSLDSNSMGKRWPYMEWTDWCGDFEWHKDKKPKEKDKDNTAYVTINWDPILEKLGFKDKATGE